MGVLVLLHEVSHNLVFSEPTIKSPKNRLLGILCNTVMLVPISEVKKKKKKEKVKVKKKCTKKDQ
jgi:hypothetical protein